MKIRSKFILSFLAIVIIPFLVLFGITYVLNSNIVDIKYLDNLEKFSVEEANLIQTFENHYFYTVNKSLMNKHLEGFESSFNRIFLIKDEKIIFDSQDSLNNKNINELDQLMEINSSYEENLFLDLENNDKVKLIVFPAEKFANVEDIIFILPLVLLGIFVSVVIIVIIVLSKFLSNSVLRPLNEINYAIDEILHGNYEYTIQSEKNENEMNKLINKFNVMKNQMKENIDARNKYEHSKKELLASITHDLKTPLSSIRGYVEALQDGMAKDQETYDRYLNIINDKASKLNHLIDDLFTFTKMDMDEFSINLEYINSKNFLENYLKSKEAEFEDSTINLIVKRPLIETIIKIDSQRITQVLENLIENAKKFSKDYIKIYTELNSDMLVINVEDNGIGISEDDKKDIFKLFYKTDKSRTSPDKTGSGIGLAICKRIMEAHQGKIELTSDDKITTFKVSFKIQTEKH